MRAAWMVLMIGGMSLLPAAGHAEGVVLSPSALEAPVRIKLAGGIAGAKKTHGDAFRRIRALRGHMPEAYRRFRGQEPNVLPELHSLGPGAGWALIEAIAFTPLDRGAASKAEWDAVREGLLLALGDLEMPEASPVLRHVFASSGHDWIALRAAAVGLGKLGGGIERTTLLAALRRGGLERDAALWGLRYVRRPEVVEAVSPLLERGDGDEVRLAARTLGYVGSSWAWRTGKAGEQAHEMPIRTRCTEVLLDVFLRYGGPVREQITRSLSMVAHPGIAAMIDERLQGVIDVEDRRALEGLKERVGSR